MGIALAIKSGGSEHVLAVSGRASFQLVQKAVMAGNSGARRRGCAVEPGGERRGSG